MRCDLSSTRDPPDAVTLRSQVRQNPISPVISPQDGVSRASQVITAKEQLRRDDHAERLDVVERGLTTRVMITREADRGPLRSAENQAPAVTACEEPSQTGTCLSSRSPSEG